MSVKKNAGKKSVPLSLFESRPVVGGLKLNPLSAGRILILEKMESPVVIGAKSGESVSAYYLFLVLLVASLDSRELAELSFEGDEEFLIRARMLGIDFPAGALSELWELIERELGETDSAPALPNQPRAGRGRPQRSRGIPETNRPGGWDTRQTWRRRRGGVVSLSSGNCPLRWGSG